MFEKILIANRGEIAVRVIRACHEMGIKAVAVFSEADRKGLHVQLADEAFLLGPAPALESYLRQDKILEIARRSGAQAVHPGYGFLAENAEFAAKLKEAGIVFVGPPAKAIELMGDKTAARKLAQKLGVPTIPGTLDPIVTPAEALTIAEEVGYPVLLKAAAGGGGKGMRLIRSREEMEKSFRAAQNEARSAFGDERIYLEKYLEQPRHIEFQILADQQGRVVHLWERECSIQRRHQKLVEEAPSVLLTPELREKMGAAAVRLTRAAGYVNAGTIEFLVDRQMNFYFLEMNTRLQVEHPVTEWVTGLDLVKEQIRIAAGEPLEIKQEDVKPTGHAIECRIYAEDPGNNFLPSTGTISFLHEPNGNGVRCDSGVMAGLPVYPFYDPLLAKLIVWGRTREEAVERMKRAMREYRLYGVETTIPFFIRLMDHQAFREGRLSTNFLNEHNVFQNGIVDDQTQMASAISVLVAHAQQKKKSLMQNKTDGAQKQSNWKILGRTQGLREL